MSIVKTWTKSRTVHPPNAFTGVDTYSYTLPAGKKFVRATIRRLSGSAGAHAVVIASPPAGASGRVKVRVRWNVATFTPPGKLSYRLSLDASEAPEIGKAQRDFLLVSCVANYAIPRGQRWKNLYHWLDTLAVPTSEAILAPHYRKIHKLVGRDATYEAFLDSLASITRRSACKAVDVAVQLHGYGTPGQDGGKLSFADGSVKVADICRDLRARELPRKLRMLYSAACYGACHIQSFLDAGFRVVSGARAVNTNSEFSYTSSMSAWVANQSYRKCIDLGNNPGFVHVHDQIAEGMGFVGAHAADSFKILGGAGRTKITSRC